MRTLDEARIGTILPDLPGQNESLAPDESIGLAVWRAALERLAGQSGVSIGMVAAFRSGAMLDDAIVCSRHWRLAPEDGPSLLRHLIRTRLAADREEGISGSKDLLLAQARHESMEFAGASLPPGMIHELENATLPKHHNVRTVQVEGSSATAEHYISGKQHRRQHEPGHTNWMAHQKND